MNNLMTRLQEMANNHFVLPFDRETARMAIREIEGRASPWDDAMVEELTALEAGVRSIA